MNEKDLIELWNAKRSQIIMAQIAPSFVLIAVFVLAGFDKFAMASDGTKYFVLGVTAVTGILAIISQYAAVREGESIVEDLGEDTDQIIYAGFSNLGNAAIAGLPLTSMIGTSVARDSQGAPIIEGNGTYATNNDTEYKNNPYALICKCQKNTNQSIFFIFIIQSNILIILI